MMTKHDEDSENKDVVGTQVELTKFQPAMEQLLMSEARNGEPGQVQAVDESRALGGGLAAAPLVLAVDTSTAAFAAALLRGAEVLGRRQSLAERNHSVHIIPELKALLEACEVKGEQLSLIAAGQGPGSYTGMRIAVTAAKTLAWAWGTPLVGVSSLEALAWGAARSAATAGQVVEAEKTAAAGQSAGVNEHAASTNKQATGTNKQATGTNTTVWYVPLMDARRGQVYTALFAVAVDGAWQRLLPDGIRLMADWVDELVALAAMISAQANAAPTRIIFTGDPALHEAEALRLAKTSGYSGGPVEVSPSLMEGVALAELGLRVWQDGGVQQVHAFAPNYTQATEAEVKLAANKVAKSQDAR